VDVRGLVLSSALAHTLALLSRAARAQPCRRVPIAHYAITHIYHVAHYQSITHTGITSHTTSVSHTHIYHVAHYQRITHTQLSRRALSEYHTHSHHVTHCQSIIHIVITLSLSPWTPHPPCHPVRLACRHEIGGATAPSKHATFVQPSWSVSTPYILRTAILVRVYPMQLAYSHLGPSSTLLYPVQLAYSHLGPSLLGKSLPHATCV
jgi:hypothetical protein